MLLGSTFRIWLSGIALVGFCWLQGPLAAQESDAAPAAVPAAPSGDEKPSPVPPATEAPATPAGETADASFSAAAGAWREFEKEIRSIVEKFQIAATDAERDALKKQYEALVAQAPAKIDALREAAVAAFAAAPNKNPEVTSTLARALADDVRQDRYDAALALAKKLLEQGCTDGLVLNFAGIAAFGADDFTSAAAWLKQADAAGQLTADGSRCLEEAPGAAERFAREQEIRAKEAAANDLPRVKLETEHGALVIELFENEAPETVGNFIHLVEKGYYNGLTFHRVLGNFMAQGGCPEGTGTGGPGYNIFCECQKPEHRNHFRGTLSMAHAGKDTGGSQFFLTFRSTPFLDGRHTAFGRVVEGLEVLPQILRRDPDRGGPAEKIVQATVIRKREHAYEPRKVE
jgi:cyclophilin family peptidyl-prolyl cis-trans isomerase